MRYPIIEAITGLLFVFYYVMFFILQRGPCAASPDRVGAGATFHGGGLVGANDRSPHLLVPKMKSQMLIAIAASDDKTQPDAKDKLKESFGSANLKAEIEVYPTAHGWSGSA